jgi:D-alanine-D-alanine ligase
MSHVPWPPVFVAQETTTVKIGITYNVRPQSTGENIAAAACRTSASDGGLDLPGDDQLEEFDAPETIEALAAALRDLGHEVELLGDGEPLVRRLLADERPDLVWNIAEGQGSGRCREARVPALLELLGIPYTGSDPLALAATLDKDCAKRLVASAGVATPRWLLFDGDWSAARDRMAALAFPVFVKPAYEGSSKGILDTSIIRDLPHLQRVLAQLSDVYGQPLLVEEFIDGDELTVGLVGNGPPEVLGIMRVVPRDASPGPFVYSLEVKRDWRRRVRYECPARLVPRASESVAQAALACWQVLGCRDVARFDFRLRDGVPYYLETNPLPGLSPDSGDLVLLAGQLGISYHDLIARILTAAVDRLNLARAPALVV